MADEDDLKPCPVCGEEPSEITVNNGKNTIRFYYIACLRTKKCFGRTRTSLFLTPAKAIDMWNLRAEKGRING